MPGVRRALCALVCFYVAFCAFAVSVSPARADDGMSAAIQNYLDRHPQIGWVIVGDICPTGFVTPADRAAWNLTASRYKRVAGVHVSDTTVGGTACHHYAYDPSTGVTGKHSGPYPIGHFVVEKVGSPNAIPGGDYSVHISLHFVPSAFGKSLIENHLIKPVDVPHDNPDVGYNLHKTPAGAWAVDE